MSDNAISDLIELNKKAKEHERIGKLNKQKKKEFSNNRFAEYLSNIEDCFSKDKALDMGLGINKNATELQKDRLDKLGLKLEYQFYRNYYGLDCKKISYKNNTRNYAFGTDYASAFVDRKITKNGKQIFHQVKKSIIYETDIDNSSQQLDENALYKCPHCGSTTTVKELLENGCSYCKTMFKKEDLVPKIVSHYYVDDISGDANNKLLYFIKVSKIITLFYLVLLVAPMTMSSFLAGETFAAIGGLLLAIILGIPAIYFMCYIGTSIFLLFGLFGSAAKASSLMFGHLGTKNNIKLLEQYFPTLPKALFDGQILSIIKYLIYTDNLTKYTPIYEGQDLTTFDEQSINVIDTTFRGLSTIKNVQVNNGYAYVYTDFYMEDLVYRGSYASQENWIYSLVLCKQIDTPFKPMMTIETVKCNHCGGTFDTTKYKVCPYCRQKHNFAKDDWVVLSINRHK